MVVALMSHLGHQKEPFHACNARHSGWIRVAPREAYKKPVFSIKHRKKTHANRWGRKKRAVWRANYDLDPKPSIRKNLTSEKTSSVEAAVSAGRDEASWLLLRCRSFATPCVFLAWNYTCDSQWQMFGSVLEAPGLAGRAFSYECILSPVGRSAQMPAAFLIPSSPLRSCNMKRLMTLHCIALRPNGISLKPPNDRVKRLI